MSAVGRFGRGEGDERRVMVHTFKNQRTLLAFLIIIFMLHVKPPHGVGDDMRSPAVRILDSGDNCPGDEMSLRTVPGVKDDRAAVVPKGT